MSKPEPRPDFFWPLAAFAMAAIAILVLGAVLLVAGLDRSALAREQTVVANGLQSRAQEVSQMVVPQAVWDEALRRLDNRFDLAWARMNIGAFLIDTDGFDETFILDAKDEPIFSAHGAQSETGGQYGAYATSFRPLVLAARAAEKHRLAAGATGSTLKSPIQATAFGRVNDVPSVLTITVVGSDFGKARSMGPRAPLVATVMTVDARFLEDFSRRYMLANLHLHPGDATAEPDEAHAVMRGPTGAVVATLDWTPQKPASALFRGLLPPILLVITALVVVALALYRRSWRISQGLIASEARAAHLAYYDALTGLPNRTLFDDRLSLALAQARRSGETVAVLCIDLDRFKFVNDTYGHQTGDELIQEAARIMSGECRDYDCFSRLSGDEFAVFMTDATPLTAAALAGRLTKAMAQPVDLAAGRVFIGCSIGIAMVSDPLIDPWEGLRQADLALYRAKDAGKDQYRFFEIEMDLAVKTRRALEGDLRAALDKGDLFMAYQPQVNGKGVMTGVEALIRWNHPTRGALSPGFFVPIAEECGLVDTLGFYALRRAFEDSRRWDGLRIAVNISANHLRIKDFVGRLEALVGEMGVDPRQFELEITETALLGDDPLTHAQLKQLRAMGFSLALDDFGTGYSSLSYLQRYPISKIKIDRSFVTHLGIDSDSDAVVAAIVKLARALRLSVIAEGVETLDQRERLAQAGCGSIQGYLFSKPVGPDAIDKLRLRPKAALKPESVAA